MTTIESAIDSAYQAQIKNLYNALSQAVLAANGDADAICAAETSFKKGLIFAADIRARAMAAIA